MNVYRAPEQPRWQPRAEQDITEAIDGGLIAETHYLDLKREFGRSSGERKELGRDLASFAIDGGALLIGLAELKEERTWRLAPQPLDGLAERVEQIATQLIDPPLSVQATDIPSARRTQPLATCSSRCRRARSRRTCSTASTSVAATAHGYGCPTPRSSGTTAGAYR